MLLDESLFNLEFLDRRGRVWRYRQYVNAIMRCHERFGGGLVMVWGGITMTGRSAPPPHPQYRARKGHWAVLLGHPLLSGARCSSVVRAFAHGAMSRRIDPSWGGPIELFLIPASAP